MPASEALVTDADEISLPAVTKRGGGWYETRMVNCGKEN